MLINTYDKKTSVGKTHLYIQFKLWNNKPRCSNKNKHLLSHVLIILLLIIRVKRPFYWIMFPSSVG